MNRPELYHKTVDILVQAYFNDTLKHGTGCGCAVGNMVCANLYNGDFKRWSYDYSWPSWNAVIDYSFSKPDLKSYHGVAKDQIDSTGYSVRELAEIEKAFESANVIKTYSEENKFNGLMAVIEALDVIHENKDLELSTKSKNRFNKTSSTHKGR